LLMFSKIIEHVVLQRTAPRRVLRSDADEQARLFLRLYDALDALQPIVAAGASLRAKAITAQRQRDFVNDDHEVGGGGPEWTPHVRAKHAAAEVHIGERLDEPHLDVSNGARCDARLAVFSPAVKMPNVGEVVDD